MASKDTLSFFNLWEEGINEVFLAPTLTFKFLGYIIFQLLYPSTRATDEDT